MSSSIGTCIKCQGQTHITESGDGMLWIDCTNCSYRAYRIPPAVLARWDEEDEAERKAAKAAAEAASPKRAALQTAKGK